MKMHPQLAELVVKTSYRFLLTEMRLEWKENAAAVR